MSPPIHKNQYMYWLDCTEQVKVDGLWLEFGVATGDSTTFLAHQTKKTFYGFDSFQGPPEIWDIGTILTPYMMRAMFQSNGSPPEIENENVEFVQGWFRDTLPKFIEEHKEPIAFLHVDCDLYSSTNAVMHYLYPQIIEGTIIMFDELYGFPNYEEHEHKALMESNLEYKFIAYQGKNRATIQVTGTGKRPPLMPKSKWKRHNAFEKTENKNALGHSIYSITCGFWGIEYQHVDIDALCLGCQKLPFTKMD